jgi:hypothetical protein
MTTYKAKVLGGHAEETKSGDPVAVLRLGLETDRGITEVQTRVVFSSDYSDWAKARMAVAGAWFEGDELKFTPDTVFDVQYKQTSGAAGKVYHNYDIIVPRKEASSETKAKLAALTAPPPKPLTRQQPPPPRQAPASTPPPVVKKQEATRDSAWKAICVHADANQVDANGLWVKFIQLSEAEFSITEDRFGDEQWTFVEAQVFPSGM